jgi:hypothetical protein
MSDEAAERRRRIEHPEDFIADDEIKAYAEKLSAKVGFEQPKDLVIPEPVLLSCPHCSAELPVPQNIRFWEPEELEQQAARIREIRRLADKNRGAA